MNPSIPVPTPAYASLVAAATLATEEQIIDERASGPTLPPGAAAFPRISLPVEMLAETVVKLALAQLAKQIGGAAEDFVETHKDRILRVVPGAVLDLNRHLLDVLQD